MTHLSDDVLGDPAGAEEHPHLVTCERCRSAVADQRAVRELLRALADPGPMPASTARDLDAALREAAGAGPAPGPTVLPSTTAASRTAARSHPAIRRTLVAAAVVVLLVGGAGTLLARQQPTPQSATSAGGSARSQSAPAPAEAGGPAASVVASGTAYTRANVVTKAANLARSMRAGTLAPQLAVPTGALGSASGLDGCLRALGAPSRPIVVDLATYEGRPAAVLVLPEDGGGEAVWVVARDCRPGADGTMFYSRLP